MVQPVQGVRLGVAQAGIKQPDRDDLVLIELAAGSVSVGLFTQNAFRAAPVQLAQKHLEDTAGKVSYWLINTGNANAGTGALGYEVAENSCAAVAQLQGCKAAEVLPFSTGVIGEPLLLEPITEALPAACKDLSEGRWQRASEAILTTDTHAKLASRVISIAGTQVTLTGMAKGAGMIRPDMATMLAFVATDAEMSSALLERVFRQAVSASFNRITVDGDTSTNDAAILVATGRSDVVIEAGGTEYLLAFTEALESLCLELAQAIIRDGEGATKFVEIKVEGGVNADECDSVAYTIAHSPLVKTALFASDPNWGRLLAAIGRAGLKNLRVEDVSVYINDVLVATNGARAPDYTEAKGQAAMASSDLVVRINLNRGATSSRVWTTDFSYGYVRINAEYRT